MEIEVEADMFTMDRAQALLLRCIPYLDETAAFLEDSNSSLPTWHYRLLRDEIESYLNAPTE